MITRSRRQNEPGESSRAARICGTCAPNVPPLAFDRAALAGAYNLAFGLGAVLFPTWWFTTAGLEPPNYPALWQCIGMIVGVYGVGYWLAARAPLVHWPIVLVGLLGKVFGPIGFVLAATRGELPWTFGWVLLTNDLIWWLPFASMLLAARRAAHP